MEKYPLEDMNRSFLEGMQPPASKFKKWRQSLANASSKVSDHKTKADERSEPFSSKASSQISRDITKRVFTANYPLGDMNRTYLEGMDSEDEEEVAEGKR
jgi:hypothetical protein